MKAEPKKCGALVLMEKIPFLFAMRETPETGYGGKAGHVGAFPFGSGFLSPGSRHHPQLLWGLWTS